MAKINDNVSAIKDFIRGLINKDMDADTIKSYNDILGKADEIIGEYDGLEKELVSTKDIVVHLVKTQGNDNPPKDPTKPDQEKQPRSLEEIARDKINGGK